MNTPNTNNVLKQNEDNQNDKLNPQFDLSFIKEVQADAEQLIKKGEEAHFSENLKVILATKEKLKTLKSNEIKFSEPVLLQGGNPVIFPHTINVIQGQAGVHKSRLAENICAAFLKLNTCNSQLLGFKRKNVDAVHTVVYVDTERNLSEQLPFALQSIQVQAGYYLGDHPANFEYLSLLQINRKDRFTALNEYLNYLKQTTGNALFIVLDVSTDCIEDFNKTDKSMELIDLMNMAINQHNVIFLCLIHENPKSDKARGHFGTELMNKASTVMQVGFEKDAFQNDTEIIRVKYLKCRSTARHAPFYIKFSQEANGLVLADAGEVSYAVNSRKHKASNEDIIEFVEMYLGDGMELSRTLFLDRLCKDFKASQRTIENRISDMLKEETEIINQKGERCKLHKETREKTVYYKLLINETF